MSDSVTITTLILAAIPTTIASILGATLAYMSFRESSKTHKLVNGSMLVQLRLHAKTARSKADITSDKIDLAVADLAEKMLTEHEDKLFLMASGQG